MPWVTYTHISHTNSGKKDNATSFFDWGKYYEKNGKIVIPISVQAHHSFVDGIHIGQFVDKLQSIFRSGGVGFMLEIIKRALEELTQNVAEKAKKNSGVVQDKLLALLKLDNKISARSAADKLEMSERQVQRVLKNMKDEGIIERVGSNRNGTWKVL